MKKILAIVLFVGAFAISADAQTKFGVGANFFDGEFGVQGKVHNTFSEDIAGQGSFSYFFVSPGTWWSLDLDLHYSGFDIGDVESFSLTPFAGLNVFGFSAFGVSDTDININVGMNGTMPLSDSMDFFVEPKLTLGGNTAFGIAAGIYF